MVFLLTGEDDAAAVRKDRGRRETRVDANERTADGHAANAADHERQIEERGWRAMRRVLVRLLAGLAVVAALLFSVSGNARQPAARTAPAVAITRAWQPCAAPGLSR
jgi:hypothetical protein